MPTISERVRNLKTVYRIDNNLDPKLATIITQNGSMLDPLIPGNYFVAYPTSNGLSTVRSVGGPAQMLPLKPGKAVILERFRGKLRIKEIDTGRVLASGGDPAADLQYKKETSVAQGSLETLRLVPKSGLTVSLRGWNPKTDVYHEFSQPDIDLTPYVPSAGNKRYAVIAVLSNLSGVEIATSTPRAINDLELNIDDVNEASALLSKNSTGAWAVKLIGGQTSVSQADIDNDAKDLRQIVNVDVITTLTSQVTALLDIISRLVQPVADVLQAQIFDFDPMFTSDPLTIQIFS